MIRAFGREGWREQWARIALAEMQRLRFNTVGNWSRMGVRAKARFPYVRPMSFSGARCGDRLPRLPRRLPLGLRSRRRGVRRATQEHRAATPPSSATS